MKCLILTDAPSDLSEVLGSCAEVSMMTVEEAVGADLTVYDAFCVLADGKIPDPRLRVRLEEEVGKGKRLFTEALNSWDGIYSAGPADTTRRRLAVIFINFLFLQDGWTSQFVDEIFRKIHFFLPKFYKF